MPVTLLDIVLDSIVARGERAHTPPPSHFLPRTKQLYFRRNHLKDNQFHCKHPGVQQFNMTLAEMTSVNLYLRCSVPPSVFCNFVAETILLTAHWVQYPISIATAIRTYHLHQSTMQALKQVSLYKCIHFSLSIHK